MNIELRIQALEDRVNDLEKQKGVAKQNPNLLPMNFNYVPAAGVTPVVYLLIQKDCSYVVDGKVTTDPTVIGQAMLDFQKKFRECQANKLNPPLLTLVPKGEA